ncbi:O-methyltransferase MdmC-like [Amblyomma americanum]
MRALAGIKQTLRRLQLRRGSRCCAGCFLTFGVARSRLWTMEPSAGSTSSSDPNRSLPGSWHPMPNSGHYVKTDHLAPGVAEYAASHSAPLHPVLAKLCTATNKHRLAGLMCDTLELRQFQVLLRATGARNYLEIGVFTGVSALAAALALPSDGHVVGLEINEENVNLGRPFWKEAGVEGKIEIVFGDAKKSLGDLISRGSCGHFDFIFIDADKESIDDYYERSLQLVRRNGVIAVDNVLWHTRTYDPAVNDPDTEAIRRLNRKLAADDRVEMCMLTMGDGVTLAVKK